MDVMSGPTSASRGMSGPPAIEIGWNISPNGAGSPSGAGVAYTQLSALVSDGVNFLPTTASNVSNRTPSDSTNPQQFHPDVSDAFPYSAPPL